jgi:signal transduction histidine kinase
MVHHEETGVILGQIVVSGGPGYSQGILGGVAVAWALAGSVAVALAVLVGWLASRQMTRPLLGLTRATARMAEGDLTVRADVNRQDEFGALAESFNHMTGRLQAYILTLQRFVADAAHELHTPLTVLRNSLDLAMDEGDQAAQLALISDGRSQVERLEELAQGLLDLSRLESGAPGPEHLPLDLVQLALKTSELYASQAEQAGLAFSLDLPINRIGHTILGDEAQLRRALGALLDNAIKFTPQRGTVELGISADEHRVSIGVEDSGIGIPEEDLPHLTGRFHRGRNASNYPGNGLGLAIVKAVADNHGGSLSFESIEGQGTRLSLHFPKAKL